MDFPRYISFTLTNACNLRCRMCAQWSREGYMHNQKNRLKEQMPLADWKRLVDEAAAHNISSLLLRGGEPFLFPHTIKLLEYLSEKGFFTAIDTNGTLLHEFAPDIVRIGNIHLTISIDGPREIHDHVRGVKGCFEKIKLGLARLHELEEKTGFKISTSANFTISPYSLPGLGAMPDVARELGIKTIAIVPFYYVPEHIGRQYSQELQQHFHCPAFSWRGFHHETPAIDLELFKYQYQLYLDNLRDLHNFPYMDFSRDDYILWFSDPITPIGDSQCLNVEKLIDIQPQGHANFCVDFPDYSFGNVRDSSIKTIWNSTKAQQFRNYRRKKPLPVCHRCGAKYMAQLAD